jgi:hypothetical protein
MLRYWHALSNGTLRARSIVHCRVAEHPKKTPFGFVMIENDVPLFGG